MTVGPGPHRFESIRSVLIIDDDPGVRDTIGAALQADGLRVSVATSGAAGLALARSVRFDLLLVDLKLPDMLGTDVVRALGREGELVRFAMISGFLTTAITVEAMKLGAIDVFEKPIDVDVVLSLVHHTVHVSQSRRPSTPQAALRPDQTLIAKPGSAADRWAIQVIKACESERDLKTLEDWASFVGLSYSSLREICRLVDIRPHDARDFMRVLRAVMTSARTGYPPEVLLDVSDGRTLKALLTHAGIEAGSAGSSISVDDFLKSQTFVPSSNAGLSVLTRLLSTPS